MDDIRDFIIDKMPAAVIVLDQKLDIIFSNRQAELFLKYHTLPDEIGTVCQRIFDAIGVSRFKESFPGEIQLRRELESSPGHWIFRIRICEDREPFVAVFIIEESLNSNPNPAIEFRRPFLEAPKCAF